MGRREIRYMNHLDETDATEIDADSYDFDNREFVSEQDYMPTEEEMTRILDERR